MRSPSKNCRSSVENTWPLTRSRVSGGSSTNFRRPHPARFRSTFFANFTSQRRSLDMADLGTLPHIIEAALNHVSGHKAGIPGVHNRSTYDREAKTALAIWAEHVGAIVEGREARVIAFPALIARTSDVYPIADEEFGPSNRVCDR